jgi:oligoribonuclease NrnB/cAMP/cGMP phosphodiesterase (DHH superfamily)
MKLTDDVKSLLSNNNKVFIFTDSDLDGTGSKIILSYYLSKLNCNPLIFLQTGIGSVESDFEKIYKYSFKDLIATSDKNSIFIFADLIPSPESVKSILFKSKLLIFDHHLTSKNQLGEVDGYIYNLDNCSCRITYDYFCNSFDYNKVADEFSNFVNTYDMWLQEENTWQTGKDLNTLLFYHCRTENTRELGYKKFIESQIRKIELLKDWKFLSSELKIIEKENKKEQDIINEVRKTLEFRTDNENNKYLFFRHYNKISILCSHFLKENPEYKYVAAYDTYKKDLKKISLRSRNNFNVREIAEKYQGGGHDSAAGFSLSGNEVFFDEFLIGESHLI